jgi:hypothetical protein
MLRPRKGKLRMYAFGLLLTVLIAVVGVGAACLVNAVATYLIARHAGRPAALWSLLALTPGVNVPSSLYFYLTTILRILDDLAALKQADASAQNRD